MAHRRSDMSRVIEAIFENGMLRPLSEPHLKDHQRVKIEIISDDDESSVETQKKILLEFAGVRQSDSTDVARNHDRYIYVKD
jgi:predicted DNA-binding antitoxin AbrB/MazE fold protein